MLKKEAKHEMHHITIILSIELKPLVTCHTYTVPKVTSYTKAIKAIYLYIFFAVRMVVANKC